MTHEARRYLHRIRALLPCTRKEKDGVLAPLRSNVVSFLEDQPNASYLTLCTRFGAPADIAAQMLATMDTSVVLSKLLFRKRIFIGLIIFFAIVYITFSTSIILSLVDAHRSYYGTFEETIEYLPSDTVIIDETSDQP